MKSSSILALLTLAGVLCGAPYFFRGGEVLAAELSERKIDIRDFDADRFGNLPERRVYATVTLKIPAGRKLALTDFELVAFDRAYPCVALRVGKSYLFSGQPVEISAVSGEIYTLLFILDRAFAGLDDREKITLRCAYSGGEAVSADLIFINRRQEAFTPSYFLPDAGAF